MTTPIPRLPHHAPDAWETVLDDVEGAFTALLPKGWHNRAWLERRGPAIHDLATSSSPDGETSLFVGDPRLPQFVMPGAFPPPAGVVVRPFVSIEHFLPDYTRDRFGGLPGYLPVGMGPDPDLHGLITHRIQQAGGSGPWVTAARLTFDFGSDPVRHALLLGTTVALAPVWFAKVSGVTTTGDPHAWVPTLLTMLANSNATPETERRQMQERAASAAAHQQTMAMLDTNAAILRSNHRQNMATLGAIAIGHQRHMDAIRVSHAAHTDWGHDREMGLDAAHAPAPDDAHRRFLDLVAEQRTVVDGEGHTEKVADGYDRYFRHRSDGTWIGTTADRDLHGLPGIDPTQFDEWKVKP